VWHGTYHCSAARGAPEFTMRVRIQVSQGVGTWARAGEGPGNQSLTMRFTGQQVLFQRVYTANQGTIVSTANLTARFEGNAVTGSGAEATGRTCEASFTR
jgi:hypothetical protein